MGNTMVGASLVDLKYVYGVSQESISNAPLMIAVGYVFGALGSGQVTRWYNNRQIIMASILIPMALVNFAILHSPFPLVLGLLFFYGAGFGSCDALLSVWIIELWPTLNSVILPLTVVLFGVGQVVAPMLMSPFVYGEWKANSTNNVTAEERVSSLLVPYTICGVFQIIMPILYIIFNFTNFRYVCPDIKKGDDDDSELDPRIAKNPYRTYHLVIAGVAVAAYGGCGQGWNAFGSTMFQHLKDDFIDASEAAHIMAYFSIAFSVGLFVTTFVALKLTPDTIIFYQLGIIFLGLFTIFFGSDSKTSIYIGTILMGYGMAPLWSMKFAFIGKFLDISSVKFLIQFFTRKPSETHRPNRLMLHSIIWRIRHCGSIDSSTNSRK